MKETFFNGINGDNAEYFPSLTSRDLSRMAQGLPQAPERVDELEDWDARTNHDHLGPKEGIDPKDLAQTGWGVVFAADVEPGVREALSELLDHRQQQATRQRENYYREFSGDDGYRPGESEWDFLDRHEAGFGAADPEQVPYYLLLVGGPESIPYEFQYDLCVEYAAGRLHLDSPEQYAAYARAVVESERGVPTQSPTAAFFGVRNPDDLSTQQSSEFLVEPMAGFLEAMTSSTSWNVESHIAEGATKARLGQLLGGDATPSLLLSASHGLWYRGGSSRQLTHQGAVLCQDWPGPKAWKGQSIPDDFVFAADDVASDARLQGLIAFHFGCYGAGCTRVDDYAHRQPGEAARQVAPRDFIAALPKRLLGHPAGGALAMIAHVERSWGYSYLGMQGGERLQTFKNTFERLVGGHPVGSAMEYFNRRYANISVGLNRELLRVQRHGKKADDSQLSSWWTARNDARSYVILGDPAVRLAVPAVTPSAVTSSEQETSL